MKIIDLFVKISQGKKVPNEIKYQDVIFEFDEGTVQYYEKGVSHVADSSLRSMLSDFKDLNNKVEPMDEIEKIKILTDETDMKYVSNDRNEKLSYSKIDLMFADRINKLTYEVNKLKGEK